jgi:hypothetical protein
MYTGHGKDSNPPPFVESVEPRGRRSNIVSRLREWGRMGHGEREVETRGERREGFEVECAGPAAEPAPTCAHTVQYSYSLLGVNNV